MNVPPGLARLARFGVVGVANTGVYYVCYLALIGTFPYMAAHLIAFPISVVFSYFMNCYLTFRTRPRWRTFLLFPLSSVTNLAVSTAGLRLAVARFHADPRFAPLEVALVAVPITYVVAHRIMRGRLRGVAVSDDDPKVVR